MTPGPRDIARTAALVALALGAASGCAPAAAGPSPALARGRPIFDAPWTWVDDEGASTRLDRWRGRPLVVTAFYASCTVRCPMTIGRLRRIDEALRAHGRSAEFVLVTLDPLEDTTGRLHRLKEARHLPPDWHLLRGTPEETEALARALDLRVMRDSGHIDHDVKIAFFDASGRLTRSFSGWAFSDEEALASLP